MNILKQFFVASIFVFSIGSAVVWAQGISPAVVAVVNIEKVERGSVAWKSLSTQINEQRIVFKNEVTALQNNLKAKSEELETQRAILSAEAFAQKVKEFQSNRNSLQQESAKRKKLLDKVYAVGRQQIRTALNKVIVAYSEAENIEMVLNIGSKAGVVHYAKMDKFDISKKVLELLDIEIQTVNLSGQ